MVSPRGIRPGRAGGGKRGGGCMRPASGQGTASSSGSAGGLFVPRPCSGVGCPTRRHARHERPDSTADHASGALPISRARLTGANTRAIIAPKCNMAAHSPWPMAGELQIIQLFTTVGRKANLDSNDPERRVSARSPGPCPSLSVTLVIGITSRPTFDPAPSDMLELTRDMRQKRTTALMTAMYKYSGRLTMR